MRSISVTGTWRLRHRNPQRRDVDGVRSRPTSSDWKRVGAPGVPRCDRRRCASTRLRHRTLRAADRRAAQQAGDQPTLAEAWKNGLTIRYRSPCARPTIVDQASTRAHSARASSADALRLAGGADVNRISATSSPRSCAGPGGHLRIVTASPAARGVPVGAVEYQAALERQEPLAREESA